MNDPIPGTGSTYLDIKEDVESALESNQPVLAMETTIVSHGMPYPRNLEVARKGIELARERRVVPAPIAILGGRIKIGLSDDEIEHLATSENIEKVSRRDLSRCVTGSLDGATTVSATMYCARLSGISVFATGGIGGVHHGATRSFDISSDLIEIGRTPVLVVSAGAKAILDLPATMEYLETQGVPVIGYGTDEFPAFYSRESGVSVPIRLDSPAEIAELYHAQRKLGLEQGILVANPIDAEDEIPSDVVRAYIDTALTECTERGISGSEVTPFLLSRVAELSSGATLEANISLYNNNIGLACDIARRL